MPDAGGVNKGLLRPVGFKSGQYFARRNFFRCNYCRFITAREKRARTASIRISPQARLMVGYSGYTGYELCDSLQSNQGRLAGIDFVDKNSQARARSPGHGRYSFTSLNHLHETTPNR